jgi:CDP-glycerol glycerophosphotransferase
MAAVARLSVVVPVYNVEEFLHSCLDSVAAQTFGDLEVIMVDDGSTDGSAAIAQEFAARDPRFRLVSQENAGLSAARNTGTAHAGGEYLAFLDSDDELPPNAYELLVGSLEQTGSDFATGNVHRLRSFGTRQSPFLARTFAETRLKTHVTKFRLLLADRPAWNKVWRRTFWDRHGFRFPEGRIFEDTPVTLPAHFVARSVDVISDPVYHWRIREGGGLSITERRLEPRALRDRMTAIEEVSDFLAEHGPRGAKRWYDESVVADDLRYYLNALDAADDDYRALFLDRVNPFLDRASKRVFDPLPAIDRLKWHFVRRRLMPELLEVLRFAKEDLATTPPVRVRGRWYGDYPFRTDRRLEVPSSVYRLEGELYLRAHLEELSRDGDALRLRGHAYVNGVGAAAEGAQQVELAALRPGRLRRLRLLTSAVRGRAVSTLRPEVTGNSRQALCDISWSGFEATLDPRKLRRREGPWELYLTVRAGGVKRRRSRFLLDGPRPIQALELALAGDLTVTASATPAGEVAVDLRRQAATLRGARLLDDGVLELAGELRLPAAGEKPGLELREEREDRRVRVPLKVAGEAFTARVRIDRLRAGEQAEDEDQDEDDGGERDSAGDDGLDDAQDQTAWDLWVVEGGRQTPLMPGHELPETPPTAGDREAAVVPGPRGAVVVVRPPAAVVTGARWTEAGELELRGRLPAGSEELLLVREGRGERHAFAVEHDGAGAFTATLTPTRISSLAGELPLQEGAWRLRAPAGPVVLAGELADRLPLTAVVDHKAFVLGVRRNGGAALSVRRDLDDDERGRYHQERLRRTVYVTGRSAPLRDAVVYNSFLGRQYSDSPRAIHEELVRRGAPLEHLWVVRDGRCRVPETATLLREGSREYHEALAQARFVVANDHFPDWFARRSDQICLQTWHGTPFKRLGFDVSDLRKQIRKFERRWRQQIDNWQYVVSPNAFSTPILRRAYAIEGEMLETGYPRVDVLARPDRDELARDLRRRLGLPEDKLTVLYAPTYRDQVVDRRGRFRLEQALDVERLRAAVGDDAVILYRKHHYILDAAPATADGFVRDVSSYPDGTELLLAADVLVTDYSSMMVDYANTGRPMLFYTYDLDAYRDEIRGFYLDFVESVPGPLLRTTDELAEALRDLDGVRSAYADRYAAFRERFCELDDGRASGRVVDAVFNR